MNKNKAGGSHDAGRQSFFLSGRLGYIEARERIYIPLYARGVTATAAFAALAELAGRENVALVDFDGYDHVKMGKSYDDVRADPSKPLGHSFVLAMLLDGAPFPI